MTKFLGFCVDIYNTNKHNFYEMSIHKVFSDNITECIRLWEMGENEMEWVTGLPFSEIEKMSDFQIAQIIAENSQPYGIVGSDDENPFVCEFWSAGINHYSDIKPSQKVPNEL